MTVAMLDVATLNGDLDLSVIDEFGTVHRYPLTADSEVAERSRGCDVLILNKVKIKNLAMNSIMEFTLVGENEADFAHGKLAITTPIGKALLGHQKGDVVEATTPAGSMKMEILEISL